MALELTDRIRDVPDFPKPGIVFKDVMPLVADAAYFRETVDRLAAFARPLRPDIILGAEARGFIFGGALSYLLEYGTDSLEVHSDAIPAGSRVIVHDDVLATGGTAKAKVELVEKLGAEVVGLAFV